MLGATPQTSNLRQKILVAEDDATSRKMIEMVLQRTTSGEVVVVADGMEAWKAIEASPNSFRLIIADWNMPFATGIELLQRVRAEGLRMPFIMLTGKNTLDAAMMAKDMGVSAFLPKPYTPDQLSRRVAEFLGG